MEAGTQGASAIIAWVRRVWMRAEIGPTSLDNDLDMRNEKMMVRTLPVFGLEPLVGAVPFTKMRTTEAGKG